MVIGMELFRDYFAGFEEQYVLIGGAACDVLFEHNDLSFRATKDLDVVLIVEALTPEFGEKFWRFICEGEYRNKSVSSDNPRFFRFEKPKDNKYPYMIELFSRSDFQLKEATGFTPIHFDDEVSSLSAILLDEEYYQLLLDGRTIVGSIPVLKPEYLVLFKMKAFLDLKARHDKGEEQLTRHIKKHKKDVLRLASEFMLNEIGGLSAEIKFDITTFINLLVDEPFDANLLKDYGLKNNDVIDNLKSVYL